MYWRVAGADKTKQADLESCAAGTSAPTVHRPHHRPLSALAWDPQAQQPPAFSRQPFNVSAMLQAAVAWDRCVRHADRLCRSDVPDGEIQSLNASPLVVRLTAVLAVASSGKTQQTCHRLTSMML